MEQDCHPPAVFASKTWQGGRIQQTGKPIYQQHTTRTWRQPDRIYQLVNKMPRVAFKGENYKKQHIKIKIKDKSYPSSFPFGLV